MFNKKGIQEIFAQIPATYELINTVLTLGLDSFWRRKASKLAAQYGGRRWLDVCSGTAQTAIYLSRFSDRETKIVALDFSLPMLMAGALKPQADRISFCAADAARLPFLDNTFDLVTISFATRNISSSRDMLTKYFQEFRRILKPGGRFVNLETSQPKLFILRKLFHLYIRTIVMSVGSLFSGSRRAYSYLAYTIPRFFCADELSGIIYQSGFRGVNCSSLSFGITAIHTANK